MAQTRVKVLVVEDEPLVRALLSSLLEADGFQIKSASNAAEARSATKDFDPRVAILDIELGDGPSGIDLAHILRIHHQARNRKDLQSTRCSQPPRGRKESSGSGNSPQTATPDRTLNFPSL